MRLSKKAQTAGKNVSCLPRQGEVDFAVGKRRRELFRHKHNSAIKQHWVVWWLFSCFPRTRSLPYHRTPTKTSSRDLHSFLFVSQSVKNNKTEFFDTLNPLKSVSFQGVFYITRGTVPCVMSGLNYFVFFYFAVSVRHFLTMAFCIILA